MTDQDRLHSDAPPLLGRRRPGSRGSVRCAWCGRWKTAAHQPFGAASVRSTIVSHGTCAERKVIFLATIPPWPRASLPSPEG